MKTGGEGSFVDGDGNKHYYRTGSKLFIEKDGMVTQDDRVDYITGLMLTEQQAKDIGWIK